MDVSLPRMSGDHINRRGSAIAMLLVLAAALQLAAGVGTGTGSAAGTAGADRSATSWSPCT
jgi:hypothetical protein